MQFQAPKEGQTTAIGVEVQVPKKLPRVQDSGPTVGALLGSLVSQAREGLQGVHWATLPAKPLNLLTLTIGRVYQEASLQMALPSALGKDVASQNVIPLHVVTVLLLQRNHLRGPTVMVKGILMKDTVIGNLRVIYLEKGSIHDL